MECCHHDGLLVNPYFIVHRYSDCNFGLLNIGCVGHIDWLFSMLIMISLVAFPFSLWFPCSSLCAYTVRLINACLKIAILFPCFPPDNIDVDLHLVSFKIAYFLSAN